MKAVKGRGRGLTHGRGVDESIRTVWVQSMHQCASITLATMNLSGLHSDSLQGHRQLGLSRIRRDNADLLRAVDWLHVNNPFTIVLMDDCTACLVKRSRPPVMT